MRVVVRLKHLLQTIIIVSLLHSASHRLVYLMEKKLFRNRRQSFHPEKGLITLITEKRKPATEADARNGTTRDRSTDEAQVLYDHDYHSETPETADPRPDRGWRSTDEPADRFCFHCTLKWSKGNQTFLRFPTTRHTTSSCSFLRGSKVGRM